MKAFTLKTLLSCGFSQSLYISLMKKGGAILLLALLPVSMIYADHETSPKDTVKLAYSPQQIDGADLMKVKDANFVNSLIGRVAGAAINPSASGVGGSVRMVLRGYRSILKSNNVLFTLDGVPLPRLEPEQSFNVNTSNWQTGDGIAAFSPDDIKSISVLSTAAASTLYGSRSASGVVMINTKKAHSGKLRVELGNSTTFSSPLVMPEFQQTYVAGWGEKTNHPQSWNPADFFRTGHTINNSLSLSIGNEYNQTRVSAVTMNGTGIIPNNDVDRYNFSFRNTSSLLNHRLKLDFTLRYIHTAEQNMLSQGMYGNPLVPVYLVPDVLQERISVNPDYNYKNHFEVYDPKLGANAQYWPLGNMGMGMQNPYWIINRNLYNQKKRRLLGGIGAKYDLTSWLNVAGRIHYDRDKETATEKLYASSLQANPLGSYYESEDKNTQFYSDLLFNVNKKLGDFSINATLGSSICDTKFDNSYIDGALGVVNQFNLSGLYQEIQEIQKLTGQPHLIHKIAVLGSHRGCGSTHVAVSLTCELNILGYHGIYIDSAKSVLYHGNHNGLQIFKQKNGYYYYKSFQGIPDYSDGIQFNIPKDAIQIYDLGTDVCNEKIYDMDLVLYVCNGSFWHLNDIYRNHSILKKMTASLSVICNMCSRQDASAIATLLNCSVYHFPYDSDMFKSSVQKETLIQKLLELKGGASLSDTLKGYLRKSILHHS